MIAFTTPWALLGLMALPIVVALHLFRRRFKPQAVPVLWLWGVQSQVISGGRQRTPLRNKLSLWGELLAVLALVWLWADPHLLSAQQGVHHVLLLDGHRRLLAQDEAGQATLDRARQDLSAWLLAQSRSDRFSMILAAATPRLLHRAELSRDQAVQALADWHPTDTWHDWNASIELAQEIAAQNNEAAPADQQPAQPRLMLVSDRDLTAVADQWQASFRSYGKAAENIGLIAAAWLPADDRGPDRVVVQVAQSMLQQPALLQLRAVAQADNSPVDRTQTIIAQHNIIPQSDDDQHSELHVIPVPSSLQEVMLEVVAADGRAWRDAITSDHRVQLLAPVRKSAVMAMDLPTAQAALVSQAMAAVGDVTTVAAVNADSATVELLVRAQQQGQLLNSNSNPSLGNQDLGSHKAWEVVLAATAQDQVAIGPFIMRQDHPLMADIDTTALLWQGGLPLAEAVALPGQTILLATEHQALVTWHQQQRRAVLWCNDIEQLAEHSFWPIWWANWWHHRTSFRQGLLQRQVGRGQSVTIRLPLTSTRLQIADQHMAVPADGVVRLPPLSQLGRHDLEAVAADGTTTWQDRLDVVATDPRSVATHQLVVAQATAEHNATTKVQRQRQLWQWLVPGLIAVVAMVLAWWATKREQQEALA